jgi:hypothetical protein
VCACAVGFWRQRARRKRHHAMRLHGAMRTPCVSQCPEPPLTHPPFSAHRDGTLRLWDLNTGATTRRFVGHTKDVLSVAFSVDNRQIVSGSRDKTIRLWNTLGECKYTIGEPEGHSEWVSCVRFSPITTNPIIVSGGWDKAVKVWNLTNCKLKNNLIGHTGYVNTVTVSPDGSLCASGGKDGIAMLWDLAEGKRLYSLEAGDVIMSLTFSPNRYWLCAATQSSIKIWDLESKSQVRCIQLIQCIRFIQCIEGDAVVDQGLGPHAHAHAHQGSCNSIGGTLSQVDFPIKFPRPPTGTPCPPLTPTPLHTHPHAGRGPAPRLQQGVQQARDRAVLRVARVVRRRPDAVRRIHRRPHPRVLRVLRPVSAESHDACALACVLMSESVMGNLPGNACKTARCLARCLVLSVRAAAPA